MLALKLCYEGAANTEAGIQAHNHKHHMAMTMGICPIHRTTHSDVVCACHGKKSHVQSESGHQSCHISRPNTSSNDHSGLLKSESGSMASHGIGQRVFMDSDS